MKNNALQAFQHTVFAVTKSQDVRILGLQMDAPAGSATPAFDGYADVGSPADSVVMEDVNDQANVATERADQNDESVVSSASSEPPLGSGRRRLHLGSRK